jgi:hypothetical protein
MKFSLLIVGLVSLFGVILAHADSVYEDSFFGGVNTYDATCGTFGPGTQLLMAARPL